MFLIYRYASAMNCMQLYTATHTFIFVYTYITLCAAAYVHLYIHIYMCVCMFATRERSSFLGLYAILSPNCLQICHYLLTAAAQAFAHNYVVARLATLLSSHAAFMPNNRLRFVAAQFCIRPA